MKRLLSIALLALTLPGVALTGCGAIQRLQQSNTLRGTAVGFKQWTADSCQVNFTVGQGVGLSYVLPSKVCSLVDFGSRYSIEFRNDSLVLSPFDRGGTSLTWYIGAAIDTTQRDSYAGEGK